MATNFNPFDDSSWPKERAAPGQIRLRLFANSFSIDILALEAEGRFAGNYKAVERAQKNFCSGLNDVCRGRASLASVAGEQDGGCWRAFAEKHRGVAVFGA